MIGKNPDAATFYRVRYSFMSAQVSQSQSCEDLFTTDKIILASAQQIFLHLRCLVREHKFSKLGWHFKGIRRALPLSLVLTQSTCVLPHCVLRPCTSIIRDITMVAANPIDWRLEMQGLRGCGVSL
jgi:hypothetical protein